MIPGLQEPDTVVTPAPAAPTLWEWWAQVAAEPALLEILLIGGIALVLVLVHVRLDRLVRDARSRAGVKDYLLGVEQALGEDLAGARQRLERVLAEDPENHHARLVYGEVLAALGQRAEAHKHHLFLQKAFKVDSLRNALALARNLLAVGRPAEAVEAAQRAVQLHPDAHEAVGLLFRAQLAAGFPLDAGRTGTRLAALLSDGPERVRVRARAAAALALAGTVHLRSGDADAARGLLREAHALDPESRHVHQLRGRLAFAAEGTRAVTELLTGDAPPPDAPPAPTERAMLPATRHAAAVLAPPAPYVCSVCGGALPAPVPRCADCGARGGTTLAEPKLFAAVESPSVLMDEVDANRSHVRRQLDAALAGDTAAADDLVEIGAPAVEDVLAAAARRGSDELVVLLRRMGPSILPPLFEAYGRLKERRLRNLATLLRPGEDAGVMGRIVQGFGRESLPYFERLLQTRDRDLRKVIIDFYIGLGDQQEFQKVLEHFPPVEVIHRLNAADAGALSALLRTLRAGTFLAEVIVLEPVFQRDGELLLAAGLAEDPSLLVGVLQRRGYSAQLTELLIRSLADPALARPAGAVLDSFGVAARDHLLSGFADLDRPENVRVELRRRIAALGPVVVDKVCSLCGPEPSSLDDDVIALLAAIGAAAIDPLCAAYQKTGLLERFAATLVNRHSHRRVVIIRALEALEAHDALRRMRERESDANLKLRLSQALQRLRPRADTGNDVHGESRGSHGQAG